jgi:cyclic pyranopterin monophosphate synthase
MVDVTGKDVTARTAVAQGSVQTTAAVVAAIVGNQIPKGDVLGAARIAGIMAVKRTPDVLPLCHPIAIGGAEVALTLGESGVIDITVSVRTADRTGVEMEALTAVAISGLTVIDMIKGLDPDASVEHVRVETKTGGKTGDWRRSADR